MMVVVVVVMMMMMMMTRLCESEASKIALALSEA